MKTGRRIPSSEIAFSTFSMSSQSPASLLEKQKAAFQAAKLDLVGIKPPILTQEAERADVSRNFCCESVY
jgi:hypothetical protein